MRKLHGLYVTAAALGNTLALGIRKTIEWCSLLLVGIYETCRPYPRFTLFAFTGSSAGFVLSSIRLPANTGNPVFWVGAALALGSLLIGLLGISRVLFGKKKSYGSRRTPASMPLMHKLMAAGMLMLAVAIAASVAISML